MDVSRRWFIGGALSLGAFGGCRFFECHDFKAGGKPNLTFGVVSDIHVRYVSRPDAPDWDGYGSTETLKKTFEWFRDQGVDAVLIAGDMADNGVISQLEAVATAWRAVFPNDTAPDGRRVERVFVYGNHDMGGMPYARGWLTTHGCKDEGEMQKRLIYPDPKSVWERVFHEPFEPIYRKTVKGYDFIGAHWRSMGCKGADEAFNDEIVDFYAKVGRDLDPSRPFFHVQHPHPKDTCYGPWAWGRDVGLSTRALSAFPNAVAFSGHSHYSLTDERSVWQDAFTSVGTSSLRYGALAHEEYASGGYENSSASGGDAWRLNAEKLMAAFNAGDCRQGMLWRVYDDCVAVKRREFLSGLDVGDDWVMPLPAAESKPFAYAERAKSFAAPQFASGATVTVESARRKNRGGKGRKAGQEVKAVEQDVLVVTVPAPVPVKKARLFELEFVAETRDGKKTLKRVQAVGYNHAPSHPKASAVQSCVFAAKDFAGQDVRFTVTPVGNFRLRGQALTSDWRRV